MLRLTLLTLMAAATGGCLRGGTYECRESAPCIRKDDTAGECMQGWCVYPDEGCESELRFSPHAGDGLANTCVGLDNDDDDDDASDGGGTDPTTDTADETTSATTSSCPVACDLSPGPCFAPVQPCAESAAACDYEQLPAGSSCTEGNLCFQSTCDEFGDCNVNSITTCTGGGPCTVGMGSCNPVTGECEYNPRSQGSACEDGVACTENDACDGEGRCEPGPTCPNNDNPCQVRSCIGGECVAGDMPNGMLCGQYEADRCCTGQCVNITDDEANCGGCGLACAQGQLCESIAVTTGCFPHPERTSGRCECTNDVHCPEGQSCELDPNSGGMNRCTVDRDSACPDAVFEYTMTCPSYCYYE